MDLTTVTTMKVYESLVKGRGTAKEAAIRTIDSKDASLNLESLRILILNTLLKDFPPPKLAQQEDIKSSDTRCWLLSALGRLSNGDIDSSQFVRRHLDQKWEPYNWARYWALEGLVAGQASDLKEIALKLADSPEDPLVMSLAFCILAANYDDEALQYIQKKLSGNDGDKWSMLRALRVVPIVDTAIVRKLCEIVDNSGYSDLTFDAIVALSKLHPDSQQGETAAQTLSNYLIKYRWPMMRCEQRH